MWRTTKDSNWSPAKSLRSNSPNILQLRKIFKGGESITSDYAIEFFSRFGDELGSKFDAGEEKAG
jgi:hypothetical protein